MTLRQKLGGILTFNKKAKIPDLKNIQEELGGKFFGILSSTFEERAKDASNSSLTQDNLDEMVNQYVNKNVLIATASSAIPGPMAMFTAIPELVSTLGNQMAMTYDVGCAFDQEQNLTKDLLLDIPIAAFGGDTDLAELKSSGTDLLYSPEKVLIGKAKSLSNSMVETHLKKSVLKFVPLGGPVIMAYFAKRNTKKIAKVSKGFFSDDSNLPQNESYSKTTAALLELEKIKICIDLIDADDHVDDRELAFIKPMIEGAQLSYHQKNKLLKEAQNHTTEFDINYDLFAEYPQETERFVEDLVLLAMRDEILKPVERSYILEFCQFVELDKKIALDMLNDI